MYRICKREETFLRLFAKMWQSWDHSIESDASSLELNVDWIADHLSSWLFATQISDGGAELGMMYFLTHFGPRITLLSYKWFSVSLDRRHVAGCKMAMVQVMEWRDESSGQANLLGKVQIPGQGCGVRTAAPIFLGFFKKQIQVAVPERLVNMIFPYQTLGFVFWRTATGAQTPQPCLDKRLLLKQIVFCLNRSSSLF